MAVRDGKVKTVRVDEKELAPLRPPSEVRSCGAGRQTLTTSVRRML